MSDWLKELVKAASPEPWNEGPSMPPDHEIFRSIVASNGNVVAMRIPEIRNARLMSIAPGLARALIAAREMAEYYARFFGVGVEGTLPDAAAVHAVEFLARIEALKPEEK